MVEEEEKKRRKRRRRRKEKGKYIDIKIILSKNRAFGICETIPKVYIWVVRGPDGEERERMELEKTLEIIPQSIKRKW